MRPLDSETLRPLVMRALFQSLKTQFARVYSDVARLASETGLIDTAGQVRGYYGGNLHPDEEEIVRMTLWEFIVEGVLVPGMDSANPNLPWISVTPYGKECLQSGDIQPYDPDGYISQLKAQIPDLDRILQMYIEESLQAFRRGLMLSSTVMLGGASERAAEILFTAFVSAFSRQETKERLEQKILRARSYKAAFDNFRKEVASLPSGYLPAAFKDDLEIQLDGILNWIRVCRNDAGHPTGRVIQRTLAHANLQLFIPYCRRVYDLIDHFSKNPPPIQSND